MATATPAPTPDLRNPAAVVEYAQHLIGGGETTPAGLRPVISVHPHVRGPVGSTAYRIAVSGDGFGGPASTVVVIDPRVDDTFRTEFHFRTLYSLLLRRIERRVTHPDRPETDSSVSPDEFTNS